MLHGRQAFIWLLIVQEEADQIQDVEVEQRDFQASLQSLTPSLSQEELVRYARLRERYEGSSSG